MFGHSPTGAAPELIAATLRWLALGIPAFVLVEPLARSFYARRDTRTPVVWNAAGFVVFTAAVVTATVMLHPHGGRALEIIGGATAIGQWAAVAAGAVMLSAVVRQWPLHGDLSSAAASIGRAAVMAAAVWVVVRALSPRPVLSSVAGVVCGAAVYGALSARSGELKRTITLLREARI
jgi:putative peptidoglycan lipid II flippase